MKLLHILVRAGIYGGVLMPIVILPISVHVMVFPKIIFFQTIVGVSFPAYVTLAWIDPKYRLKWTPLYLAVFGYLLAIALSVICAVDPFRAFWGDAERMGGFFTFLHFFLWFTMMVGYLKTWREWRRLLQFAVLISGVMALSAMLPTFSFILNKPRATGFAGNSISLSAYMLFNLFFALLLIVEESSFTSKLLYSLIMFIDLVAFAYSGSRGPFLGLLAGVFVFVIFHFIFVPKPNAALKRILPLLTCLLGVCIFFMLFAKNFFYEENPLARLANLQLNFQNRIYIWKAAWEGFLRYPFTGWGFDNFDSLWTFYYDPRSLRYGWVEAQIDKAHNNLLDILSMSGIIGISTYLLIFTIIIFSFFRKYNKGKIGGIFTSLFIAMVTAYLVQNLTFFDDYILCSMCGMFFALAHFFLYNEAGITEHSNPNSYKKLAFACFFFIEAVSMVIVLRTSIRPLQASYYFFQSMLTFGTQDAFENVHRASTIWTPYLQERISFGTKRFLAAVQHGKINEIARAQQWRYLLTQDIENQLKRSPLDVDALSFKAQIASTMAILGYESGKDAEIQLKKLSRMNLANPLFQYGLASFYAEFHRYDEAEKIYKRFRDADLQNGTTRWQYGHFLFYKKKDKVRGAAELIASQEVAYPYRLTLGEEHNSLKDAYLFKYNALTAD